MKISGSVESAHYKWVVLAAGMFAQASTSTFFQGLASIGPALRDSEGLTLAQLGLLLGAPMAGFVVTLLPWGLASDRFDERRVMAAGLGATAGFLLLTSFVSGLWPLCVCLVLSGAAGASVNAASGRAVLRWFTHRRRGFAMGLRQTSVPLGAAAAAVMLPTVATSLGVGVGIRILAVICLLAAVSSWLWVREPPINQSVEVPVAPVGFVAPSAPDDVTRRDRRRSFRNLVAASSSLVICQTIFVSFVVEMLHGHRQMSLRSASLVFAVAQVTGALARVAVGSWSDRMPDRLGPLRILAFAMALGGLALGVSVDGPLPLLVALCVVVGALVICWNGLAFTAAGELAPSARMGTALGLQSTANFFVASVTPFLIGTLIAMTGFTFGFGLIAVPATLAGVLLLRIHSQRTRSAATVTEAKEISR